MKTDKLLDHIFVLRPMLHIPVWTVGILGYFSYGDAESGWLEIPLMMLIGTGLFGAVFLINQIYDIESDRINDKVFFLPRGLVTPGWTWLMTIMLNVISPILAFYISFGAGVAALIIVVLGVLYSVPPISMKDRTWPAAVANGLGHGTMVFILGYCMAGGAFFTALIKSIPYFLAVAAVYVGTTLPDIKGDRETGKITISVRFGPRITQSIVLISYLVALSIGYILQAIPFLIASLAVAPFYFWLYYTKTSKATMLAVKMSVISLSLAASYLYPLYALFLLSLIFATRIYYQHRFNMEYPAIK
ncbi:MAG: UbiA family prenyltransferase [candidate division Zixibacteria bacterium]|nr:UbiA family prenyltransferase [candidate division Zixibacteria bacterium]